MKYRGVKIVKIKYSVGVDCNKSFTKSWNILKTGYGITGNNYPYELNECYEMIDRLINYVMTSCDVDEKNAVKLINTK